ncbi:MULTISPECIES: NBR1-Ig-like domain-containing protein [Nitrincola]|uniref:HTH cro/C1-type domain-containing protein n=1 Tax=Nitrincola nitratireducens TaxID=1229521 RepID=W9UPC8_9GAMM|nr:MULTISPECIES: NBR1-Ig-like domain-containing protein [Nitrincola]EXJ09063.1 hypothetical protein D791_04010 [Nitrincola nitratireducens]
MNTKLEMYVRQRCRQLNQSLAEICRLAGISRQTLYECWQGEKQPSLNTLSSLAWALQVHPMRLLHMVFEKTTLQREAQTYTPGDCSAFIRDVTHPDGALILAGTRFKKIWALQNVGNTPWTNRFLRCLDDEVVVFTKSGDVLNLAPNLQPETTLIPVPDTNPGDIVELEVTFQAPNTPGTVLSYWKMSWPDGSLCFPESRGVWVKVTIITPATAAGLISDY